MEYLPPATEIPALAPETPPLLPTDAMEQLGRALREFAEAATNAAIAITEVIAPIITIATMPIMPTMGATNKKWLHLYRYSKKVRTRKKYQKKIIEEFTKMMKEGD